MRIQASFRGFVPYIAQLRGLRKGLRTKTARSAMRKSVSLVNKTAKSLARRGKTRQLWRSLGVKVRVYPSGIVIGIVEPRVGFRVVLRVTKKGRTYYHDPRNIAHLVEGGTVARWQKKGRYTGAAQPHQFMQPALTRNEGPIERVFASEVEKALAEAAR